KWLCWPRPCCLISRFIAGPSQQAKAGLRLCSRRCCGRAWCSADARSPISISERRMSLLTLCQSIQESALSAAVGESTWGFPIVSALHVLALAWSGGAILIRELRNLAQREVNAALRLWYQLGVAALLATGALLFWVEPVKCYQSLSFRVKMALLLFI